MEEDIVHNKFIMEMAKNFIGEIAKRYPNMTLSDFKKILEEHPRG